MTLQIQRTKDLEKLYFLLHQIVLMLSEFEAGNVKLGDLIDGHRTRMFSEFQVRFALKVKFLV